MTGIAEMSVENIPDEITYEIVRKYIEPERYKTYTEMIRSGRPERVIIRKGPENIISSGFE
ncbi:MAG: hypothetical protein CL731_03140 [Chloroflexi bacterium]|nr:hypothetical protein [Chloroflexota bacterium]